MIPNLDVAFRGAAIALIAFMVIAIPRRGPARRQAWVAVAFGCGVAAYLLCSSPFAGTLPWAARALLGVGCLANPWLLWLMARTIFSDGFRSIWCHWLVLGGLLAVGLPAYLSEAGMIDRTPHAVLFGASWILFKFASVTLAVLALLEAWRGRESDLVTRRRVLRTYFVTLGAGYMLLVLMSEILLRGAAPPAFVSMLNSMCILGLVAVVAGKLLIPRFDLLLEPLQPPPASPAREPRDAALLEKLQEAIRAKVYLEDGLTIAGLADRLQTQVHRLRPLINDNLGYRNFNDFLHRLRVNDACEALSDASRAHIPVLTIALELGYGSIGPFNRAFRELTGETPTAYRRRRLGEQANMAPQ